MPNNARIVHNFVSTKPTRNDPTRIYGAQWNEDHVITGLDQVDNTSDATKWAAVATLTNKSIDGATNTLTNVPTASLSGLSANMAAWLASASSANLRAAMTDETGTGSLVFATSPTLVTPALGTPASGVLTNATGLPISTGVAGLGTGVATALAVNVGTAGAPVVNGGALGTPTSGTLTNATGLPLSTGISGAGTGVLAGLAVNVGTTGSVIINGGVLGTPSSGTLTNATGLPVSTGISGLATGVATFLATPSSANLRAALTDEVGTGAAYFVGGALGTPASGTATNVTGLPLSTGITGAGTGVLTALAVNVGTAGAPVVNGGVLGTPSSGTATNLTGLPLSGLTSQAAYSLVGNFTGSSAVPTASTIGSLTNKVTPAGSDRIIIEDAAASNALKYATLTQALAAVTSGVSAVNTFTGSVTIAAGSGMSIGNSAGTVTASRSSTPSFLATKGGTNQAGVADATLTQVTFSTEVFDVGSFFASNAWTPPAGKVLVGGSVYLAGTGIVGVIVSVYKNGVELRGGLNFPASAGLASQSVSVIDDANGTDVYTLYAYADVSSGTVTFQGNAPYTYFNGSWLGPS